MFPVKSIVTVCCLSLLSTCLAEMEVATPESQGVDSRAILKWIEACEANFDGRKAGTLHGFVIVRHGRTVAEGSWHPFDTLHETHMLYSHAKSFTSTAVGILVDAGKLDLDERLVDIFVDRLPASVSPRMRDMRVRDLLTMNDGMDPSDICVRNVEGDWIETFLSADVKNRPGEKFKYDSCATYMLSAIVERRAGMKLMDFLGERVFSKLGITNAWSTTSPQGIACGGWGMNMTTRDLARFGQLYLQRGRWNGETILSPDWVSLATTRQSWSGWINVGAQRIGEGSDWEQGYCFQFWRCRHNAYRADGAYGQLTVVMPDQDAVVSVNAGLGSMQKELDLIWEYLLPAFNDSPLPENPTAFAALSDKLNGLVITPLAGGREGVERLLGDYAIAPNTRGIRAVRLLSDGTDVRVRFYARSWMAKPFRVGFGKWEKGEIRIDNDAFEWPGSLNGVQPVWASGGIDTNGTLHVRAYLTGTTAYLDLAFSNHDGRRTVSGELWAMNGTRFTGTEMMDDPPPGEPVPLAKDREAVRRYFTERVFGVRPVARPNGLAFKTVAERDCLGGRGVYRRIEATCQGSLAPFSFSFDVYEPKGSARFASFVNVGLRGRLRREGYSAEKDDPSVPCLPVRDVVTRGFAVAMFDYCDVASDDARDCFESGVFRAFGPKVRKESSWGAISAWAWGMSRVMDWIETQDRYDSSRVAVIGHSRGGKTALWAAVDDSRFALACVNCSGAGGAKLNRMNLPWSESLDVLTVAFPHWFARAFRSIARDEKAVPHDQHELLALVAPRFVAVGSGRADEWAGPDGEYMGTLLAASAWTECGAGGCRRGIRHHFREGPHDLTPEDWAHYMDALENVK